MFVCQSWTQAEQPQFSIPLKNKKEKRRFSALSKASSKKCWAWHHKGRRIRVFDHRCSQKRSKQKSKGWTFPIWLTGHSAHYGTFNFLLWWREMRWKSVSLVNAWTHHSNFIKPNSQATSDHYERGWVPQEERKILQEGDFYFSFQVLSWNFVN